MTTLKVTAPKLRVQRNGRDALSLWIDGVEFRLMGDHADPRVRHIMCAFHMAKSIKINVSENPRFKVSR